MRPKVLAPFVKWVSNIMRCDPFAFDVPPHATPTNRRAAVVQGMAWVDAMDSLFVRRESVEQNIGNDRTGSPGRLRVGLRLLGCE